MSDCCKSTKDSTGTSESATEEASATCCEGASRA